ncbi:COQ7 protein [Cantharellus anzutake]|uniref:COQ7 protein n=1 Tax=Cantharellus anzutake TaxID=1750568 RepID=UPI001908E0DE|nr:COQ7 protein [Cantharellus anzutake]XP_038914621.1 COQ7 protein [Cantharellus anzutake]KAF8326100.1 COQ7 protein [Cantharellus anzutake]KAF8328937.1 COQ7 protein [Cantharellus anzutake]
MYLAQRIVPRYEALSQAGRNVVSEVIRVDQAGEVAANWIYRGQMAVLGKDQVLGPIIQEMWDQEKKHLRVMDKLQIEYQARPTLLMEVAKITGFGLGAVTALMGKEAAMACTEAVETAIGEHYEHQLQQLETISPNNEGISQLKDLIKELRDDELEHLGTAVAENSQRAPAHALMSAVIELGCNVAIQLCKRI